MIEDKNIIFRFNGPMGVPVEVGQSALMLFGIILFLGGSNIAYSAALVVMLFGSVLAHELGHAWGAIKQGVPVKRIMLTGGGGFCQHQRAPTPHEAELIVAMGPIVNIAIWAIASLAEHWLWTSQISAAVAQGTAPPRMASHRELAAVIFGAHQSGLRDFQHDPRATIRRRQAITACFTAFCRPPRGAAYRGRHRVGGVGVVDSRDDILLFHHRLDPVFHPIHPAASGHDARAD